MAIPWSDEAILEAVAAFMADQDYLDLSSEEALAEAYEEWSGEDEAPSTEAILARFSKMANAILLTGELEGPVDDEDDQEMRVVEEWLTQHPDVAGLTYASRRAITANGLAHYIWRSGPIETVHGGDGLAALSDGDMMRTNALVAGLVATELSGPEALTADLLRLRRALLDPQRIWPTGETLWGICEGFIGEMVGAVNGAIAGVQALADRTSPEHVFRLGLVRGVEGEAGCWSGTPWWPFTVRIFLRRAQEPTPWDPTPLVHRWPLTTSIEELELQLLGPLWALDQETADWCAGALKYCESEGREAWRQAGSPQP